MTCPNDWNAHDTPVTCKEGDQFGMWPFASLLAKGLKDMQDPEGFTVALCGAWGSGKSSVIGMVREELAADKDRVHVSEFKGWWFRGEEALAVEFLKHLDAILPKMTGEKAEGPLRKMAGRLLPLGAVIGEGLALAGAPGGKVIEKLLDLMNKWHSAEESLEELFDALKDILKKQNKRFLIIIDDIDRMTPEEALAVFRLVKTVGRLPNVMYLLAYDRELAERMVQQRFPSEGPHYLEKIVQVSYEMPYPLPYDIDAMVRKEVNKICNVPEEAIFNNFYSAIRIYLTIPRHAVRYISAIRLTWPAIANQIDTEDFLVMELFRLYDEEVFHEMRRRRSEFLKFTNEFKYKKIQAINAEIGSIILNFKGISKIKEKIVGILSSLFENYKTKRRIFHNYSYCDTYFRLSLSDDAVSKNTIDEMIERASDAEFIKDKLLEAASEKRTNGESKINVYFYELLNDINFVKNDDIGKFLGVLFGVFNGVDERNFNIINDSHRRLFEITSAIKNKLPDNEERSKVILTAMKSASLGWLTFLADILLKNIQTKPEDECLVLHRYADKIRNMALDAINNSVSKDLLIHRCDLQSILYQWYRIDENKENVKKYTDKLINKINSDDEIDKISNLHNNFNSGEGFYQIFNRQPFLEKIEELRSSGRVKETSLTTLQNIANGIQNDLNRRQ